MPSHFVLIGPVLDFHEIRVEQGRDILVALGRCTDLRRAHPLIGLRGKIGIVICAGQILRQYGRDILLRLVNAYQC